MCYKNYCCSAAYLCDGFWAQYVLLKKKEKKKLAILVRYNTNSFYLLACS